MIAFHASESTWKSHSLEHSPILRSSQLKWAQARWDPDSDTPRAQLSWGEEAQKALSQERVKAAPLAILFTGEAKIGALVVPGTIGGEDSLDVVSTPVTTERDAMREVERLVSILRTGIPMGIEAIPVAP